MVTFGQFSAIGPVEVLQSTGHPAPERWHLRSCLPM